MFPNPPRQEGFLNDNRGPIGPVRGVLRSPLQCVYLVASFQVWRIKAARLSGSLAEIRCRAKGGLTGEVSRLAPRGVKCIEPFVKEEMNEASS